jgi:hypothetical protein
VIARETIFVYLQDEGTDVWAPMDAEFVRDDVYRITNDRGENGQFKIGNLVKCRLQKLSGGQCLVASELVR